MTLTAAQETLAKAVSEKDFQQQVKDFARLHGWRTYHTFDSRRSDAGFPDIVLCRPPRLVFAELKREGKSPSALQSDWLEDLADCVAWSGRSPTEGGGVEAYFWSPSCWEAIEAALR